MRSLKRMSTIVAIVALTLGGGAFAKIAQSDVPDNMLGPLQAWPYTHSSYFMRGEMTKNANCAQPVACDTTMELLAWKYRNHRYNYWAEFKANPRNCWWDHGFR